MNENSSVKNRAIIIVILGMFLVWLAQYNQIIFGALHIWEDALLHDYPFRMFHRAAIENGELPLWTPFAFGGAPFVAVGVTSVFYPPNFLLALLPLRGESLWWALQTLITLHYLLAGVLMYAYLRYKKATRVAAFFGGVAYMMSGFLVNRIIHSVMLAFIAWLPLALYLFERGVRELKYRHAVGGGLVVGFATLAGHPQIPVYGMMFLAAYSIFLLWNLKCDYKQRILACGLFFTAAIGVALIQFLPTMEMGGWTPRTDYTIETASEGSLTFPGLLTLLMPKLFGAYTGNAGVPPFWLTDAFRHGAHNYWETAFYLGIAPIILSIFVFVKLRKNRDALFAALCALASLLIALGGNFFFYRMLYALGVPGFTTFRHPARILFIFTFVFSIASAFAIDSLEDVKKSKRLKTITLSVCGGLILLGIATAAGVMRSFFPELLANETFAKFAADQGVGLVVNAALIGVVLALFFIGKIKIKTAQYFIIGCLLIDLLSFAHGHHQVNYGVREIYGRPSIGMNNIEQIRNMQAQERFRVNARQFRVEEGQPINSQTGFMVMDRNQGLVDKIDIVEGYMALRLRHAGVPLNAENFYRMLDIYNIRYYTIPDASQPIRENKTFLPRAKLFDRAVIIGGDTLSNYTSEVEEQILNYMNSSVYRHQTEIVVTDNALARFANRRADNSATLGNVNITKYKYNSIELEVDANEESLLWLSEIYYPGWTARVNGEETKVYRANYSFRAIVVPAGKSHVVFKFNSSSFNIGATITLLTIAAALLYLLYPTFAKKFANKSANKIASPKEVA